MNPAKTDLIIEDDQPTENLVNKYRTHDDVFEDFNPTKYSKSQDREFTVLSEINVNHPRNKPSQGVNYAPPRPVISDEIVKNKYGITNTFSNLDVVGQTHVLINNLPRNILANEEAENYSKMLSSSIKKLTDELETTRLENKKLTSDLFEKEAYVDKLHDEVKELTIQNNDLRMEKESKGNDALLTRERDLLRAKLIKYRNLYQDAISNNKRIFASETGKPVPQSAPMTYEKREEPNVTNVPVSAGMNQQDYDKIVPLLTEIVEKISESREHNVSEGKSEQSKPNSNSNEIQSTNEKKSDSQGEEEFHKEDAVVNCCVYNKDAEQVKEKCRVCHENAEKDVDDRDTINLIGEYKWNI